MPRKRQKIYFDKEKQIIKGRFYGIGSTKNPPQRTLCTLAEAFYRDPYSLKGKRTKEARDRYVESIWEKTFQELSKQKKQADQKKKQEQQPKSMYWLFNRFTEYMEHRVEIGERDQDTLNQYKKTIEYYKIAHKDHLIEQRFFNQVELDRFTVVLKKNGCNKRTIWKHFVNLKSIFNWGYSQYDDSNERYIKNLIDLKLPKKPKSLPDLYTTEEVLNLENSILRDYLDGKNNLMEAKKKGRNTIKLARELLGLYILYKAVFLVRNTAMRVGEVLHLPYSHIDLESGTIEIKAVEYKHQKAEGTRRVPVTGHWNPKGNKSRRVIDISQNQVLLDFLQHDVNIKPEEETFYCGNGTGVLFFTSTTKLARKCRDKIRALGIRDDVKPFHSLRGWAITYLLAQGYPIPKVQDMVGHEDVQTTMGYYNLVENASGDLVGRLGNLNETLLINP